MATEIEKKYYIKKRNNKKVNAKYDDVKKLEKGENFPKYTGSLVSKTITEVDNGSQEAEKSNNFPKYPMKETSS